MQKQLLLALIICTILLLGCSGQKPKYTADTVPKFPAYCTDKTNPNPDIGVDKITYRYQTFDCKYQNTDGGAFLILAKQKHDNVVSEESVIKSNKALNIIDSPKDAIISDTQDRTDYKIEYEQKNCSNGLRYYFYVMKIYYKPFNPTIIDKRPSNQTYFSSRIDIFDDTLRISIFNGYESTIDLNISAKNIAQDMGILCD